MPLSNLPLFTSNKQKNTFFQQMKNSTAAPAEKTPLSGRRRTLMQPSPSSSDRMSMFATPLPQSHRKRRAPIQSASEEEENDEEDLSFLKSGDGEDSSTVVPDTLNRHDDDTTMHFDSSSSGDDDGNSDNSDQQHVQNSGEFVKKVFSHLILQPICILIARNLFHCVGRRPSFRIAAVQLQKSPVAI